MAKARSYGYIHQAKVRRKRKGRHAKNPNPKHKIFKKYRGQGR